MKKSECSFLFQVQVAFFSLHPTGPTEKCLDFNSFALHLHLLRLGDVLAAMVLHWQVRYLSFCVLQPVSIFSAHSYIQLHTATTSQEWPSLLVDICTGRSGVAGETFTEAATANSPQPSGRGLSSWILSENFKQ